MPNVMPYRMTICDGQECPPAATVAGGRLGVRGGVGAGLGVVCAVWSRYVRSVLYWRFGTLKPFETVEIVELGDDLRCFGTLC